MVFSIVEPDDSVEELIGGWIKNLRELNVMLAKASVIFSLAKVYWCLIVQFVGTKSSGTAWWILW
jgi:hypothetical protein